MTTARVATLALVLCCGVALAQPAADEITSLPGWTGPLPSRQYSGYLNISSTKHMHYWFVEAYNNSATAPTILWLNGGPGCSSLDGFFYEHGPFRINDTNPNQLLPFEYAWANLANMVYLEAPVGVGFSYSTNENDYICNDDTAARDNMLSLEKFFELFPALKNNDLYITGESYAGVYVPTLAEAILFSTENGTYTGAPLKGIAVGNGCTGNEIGVCGGQRDKYETEFFLGTAFVDPQLKIQITKACDFTRTLTPVCIELLNKMHNSLGNIDTYNVYGSCISGSFEEKAGSGSGRYKAPRGPSALKGPDACIDSILASSYLNRADVQAAIHVRRPTESWQVCGQEPGWSYTSTRPNLPRDTYPALIKNMSVRIFNGDWDNCVPYTDNQDWTANMGYPVAEAWHPWYYQVEFEGTTTQQVGGYAVRYAENNFTFLTVRGGRHEVPETAPDKAFEMIRRLVSGEQF